MALIRYPGSKSKLFYQISQHLPDSLIFANVSITNPCEYREPFFGAGAVGFRLLARLHSECRVWINDKDYWLVCLWQAVLQEPDNLMREITRFKPTADQFYQFKEQDGCPNTEPLLAGFRKLACHQMSISGFGVKSGGPLGGKEQKNKQYPVNCRWNPSTLISQVKDLSKLMRSFKTRPRITCRDYSELLDDAPKDNCAIYIDPPYVKQGPSLYKHAMTEEQHRDLAARVNKLKCFWAVSYDDDPLIRELYGQHEVHELPVVYTNATGAQGKRPKNHEVLIVPKQST